MASVMELAVPAIATLAGVGVGLGGQAALAKRQWRRDRLDKFVDDKKRAYETFLDLIESAFGIQARINQARLELEGLMRELTDSKEHSNALMACVREMTERLDRGEVPEDLDQKAEEAEKENRRAHDLGEKVSALKGEAEDMLAKGKDRSSAVRQYSLTLELIAPPEVLRPASDAAAALQAGDESSVQEHRRRFIAAARRDLLPE